MLVDVGWCWLILIDFSRCCFILVAFGLRSDCVWSFYGCVCSMFALRLRLVSVYFAFAFVTCVWSAFIAFIENVTCVWKICLQTQGLRSNAAQTLRLWLCMVPRYGGVGESKEGGWRDRGRGGEVESAILHTNYSELFPSYSRIIPQFFWVLPSETLPDLPKRTK